MTENVYELLNDEIAKELQTISEMNDIDDKTKAIANMSTLYKLKLETERISDEYEEKSRRRDLDNNAKERQYEEQKIDRIVNTAVTVGTCLISIIAYNSWYKKGLKFEETGTITSPMTKNLLSKMLPKK